MLDEKNNHQNESDPMKEQFGELKKQVLPPPALEKAVIEGSPYGRRPSPLLHVRRISKAAAAYVLGIALLLGMLVMLPHLWEGNTPVGSDPVNTTTTDPISPEPADGLTLPETHFYITRQASPEEIGELFGQRHSPDLSAWFPVITIDSPEALQAFYAKADKPLSLSLYAESTDSFSQAKVAEYDKTYFKTNVLVIGYFGSNNQGYSYALTMYSKVRDTITFGVSDYGGLVANALAGNLMVVELPRGEISGVKNFGAYLSQQSGDISVEARQTVAEIRYGGTYRFSGAYAAKLTKDLAALDYGESEIKNPEMYGPVQVETVNGSYTFLLQKGEVMHGDRSAKYGMSSILRPILDHCPNVPLKSFAGEVYLTEETRSLIATFAEPTVEGMSSVIRLDSWEELKEFIATTDEEFRTAEDTAALDAYIATQIGEYGEDFFDGYSLLVGTFYASSGSFSYYLTDVRITADHRLIMDVCQNAYLSGAHTDDVVDWTVAVRVPTELLTDVVQYGRQ